MAVVRPRVRLLGPVRLVVGGRELPAGPAKQRLALAVLALDAGRTVSRDTLIDALWGEEPPTRAEANLYTYMSRLRRLLDPSKTGEVLIAEGSGYRLDAGAVDVDAQEFSAAVDEAQARLERGDRPAALDLLDNALQLWRGRALADIEEGWVQGHRSRLEALHLLVAERWAAAVLQDGRPAEAVTALRGLLAQDPGREGGAVLLMDALVDLDDPAGALRVFDNVQTQLAESQGLAPGAALRGARRRAVEKETTRRIVGRDSERAQLRCHLDSLVRGRGSVVWIEGDRCSGRSTLLGASRSVAEGSGVRVHLIDVQGGAPVGELLSALGLAAAPDEKPDELVHRITVRVRSLSERRPLLLLADDLDAADPLGLRIWRSLAEATADRALCVVVSVLAESADLRELAAWAVRRGEFIRLGPLTEDEVTRLAAERFGRPPGSSVRELLAAAGGNPGRVCDLLAAAAAPGALTGPGGRAELARPPGDLVDAVLASWLRGLSAEADALVRTAALLGPEFDPEDLLTVLDQPASVTLPALSEARRRGLVGDAGSRVAFTHPLVWSAIRNRIPATERILRHRAAARALDRAEVVPERVAAQLLVADLPPDRWTVEWLVDHSLALADKTPKTVLELVERALRTGELRADSMTALRVLAVRIRLRLGESPLDDVLRIERTTQDEDLRAEMRLIRAYLRREDGADGDSLATVERALADPATPDLWRARLDAVRTDLVLASGPPTASLLAAAGDGAVAARIHHRLWERATFGRDHAEALRQAESGLAVVEGPSDDELALWADRVLTLDQLDRVADADLALARLRERALARGRWARGGLSAAVHLFWTGHWDDALAELDHPLPDDWYYLRRTGAFRMARGLRALIAAHRDDAFALESVVKTTRLPAGPRATESDLLVMARVEAQLQQGRPDAAVEVAMPLINGVVPALAGPHPWLPRLTRIVLDVGDDAALSALLTTACREAADEVVPARAKRALSWCSALVDGDAEAVLRIATEVAELGRAFEHGLALEDAAVLLAESGDTATAADCGAAAIARYTELAAGWDVRRTESELARRGVTVPAREGAGFAGLTEQEGRVAALVATGWSNAEIATLLSLPRAVVQDLLEAVLTKTGAPSRLALTPQALESWARRGPPLGAPGPRDPVDGQEADHFGPVR